jgi:hypothetical protein
MAGKVKILSDIESPIPCGIGGHEGVILLDIYVFVWLTALSQIDCPGMPLRQYGAPTGLAG